MDSWKERGGAFNSRTAICEVFLFLSLPPSELLSAFIFSPENKRWGLTGEKMFGFSHTP